VSRFRRQVGLRKAGAEVGLSPTGLSEFIQGTVPYPQTVAKLTRWYLETPSVRGNELTLDAAVAMLAEFTAHLPARWRPKATNAILVALEEAGRAAGCLSPSWLQETKAHNQKS